MWLVPKGPRRVRVRVRVGEGLPSLRLSFLHRWLEPPPEPPRVEVPNLGPAGRVSARSSYPGKYSRCMHREGLDPYTKLLLLLATHVRIALLLVIC